MHNHVGIRELRNQVAAVVRRAGAGERIIVTVDGAPVAQLGPISPVGAPTLADLIAAGLVHAPRSPSADGIDSPIYTPIEVAVDAGAERVIAEVRGG
jgi:prevent-host-death family protein